jgi:hypothetical protein
MSTLFNIGVEDDVQVIPSLLVIILPVVETPFAAAQNKLSLGEKAKAFQSLVPAGVREVQVMPSKLVATAPLLDVVTNNPFSQDHTMSLNACPAGRAAEVLEVTHRGIGLYLFLSNETKELVGA